MCMPSVKIGFRGVGPPGLDRQQHNDVGADWCSTLSDQLEEREVWMHVMS
jgi:hypothetical protein